MANLLESISDLPSGGLYIYGAGAAAQSFAQKLKADRPDIDVRGFLTSFETNESATNILEAKEAFDSEDSILVLNQYAREIIHSLTKNGIGNPVYDGIRQVFPWPTYNKSTDENAAYLKRAEAVAHRLKSERSRALFRFLADVRFGEGSASIEEQHGAFYALMDRCYGEGDAYAASHYFEYGDVFNARIAIEGGGNLGLVARKLLQTAPDLRLYSFEPMLAAIADRQIVSPAKGYLIEAANAGRYSEIPEALWSEPGVLYFDSSLDDIASAQAQTSGPASNQVPATSIDHFKAEAGLGSIDFIKLDVEGAEPQVLMGAWQTLTQDRPLMAISIYHGLDQIVSIPEMLFDLLSDYDFEVGHHANTPWQETVLYCIPR